MSAIDFYGLTRLHDQGLNKRAMERISALLGDCAFVEGKYNASFEKKFAKLQGAKHCLLVANGTDALELALQVLGVGPGDLVGVPGITFHASAEAVLNVGASVVLVDVDKHTGLLCPDSLERLSQKHKLKALIPVHIYGLPAPMERSTMFVPPKISPSSKTRPKLKEHFYPKGFPWALPATSPPFPFTPPRTWGRWGTAGCILTDSEEEAESIRQLRNHGRGGKSFGRNSRCDHLQAAMLDLKLENLDGHNRRRKDIAHMYHRELAGLPLELLPNSFLPLSSWHLYPVWLENIEQAEKLLHFLQERGIGCANFYAKALSQESWLSGCSGEWECAEAMAGRTVCLPIHPALSDEEVARVVREVRHFFLDKSV